MIDLRRKFTAMLAAYEGCDDADRPRQREMFVEAVMGLFAIRMARADRDRATAVNNALEYGREVEEQLRKP